MKFSEVKWFNNGTLISPKKGDLINMSIILLNDLKDSEPNVKCKCVGGFIANKFECNGETEYTLSYIVTECSSLDK